MDGMDAPRRRILVVEDDVACANMYRAALRFAGYDVDMATDGITALWRVEAHRPDLIVLDLHLPRLRGEAILAELAASPDMSSIPVIVVTSSDAADAVTLADLILDKPCDPEQLVSVIQRYLAPTA